VLRDVVDPENPCQSCQPFRSTTEWSDLDGDICHAATAEVFWPNSVLYQYIECGSQCGTPTTREPDVEQMLVKGGSAPMSQLLLDLSNLHASGSIGVTKAQLRFTVKAAGGLQPVHVFVGGQEQSVCNVPVSSTSYNEVKCDVTAAVKNWMTLPQSAERTLTIATQNAGSPVYVYSSKAETAGLRPALLLDYAASCEGDQCVTIEK
jgi:hypothetical protein